MHDASPSVVVIPSVGIIDLGGGGELINFNSHPGCCVLAIVP
jgi:hypothetical protein